MHSWRWLKHAKVSKKNKPYLILVCACVIVVSVGKLTIHNLGSTQSSPPHSPQNHTESRFQGKGDDKIDVDSGETKGGGGIGSGGAVGKDVGGVGVGVGVEGGTRGVGVGVGVERGTRGVVRRNEGQKCPKVLGTVGIFVVYTNASQYTHATDTTWCYALSKGYPFFLVQPFVDPLSVRKCGHLQQVKYRKHCAAAAYLEKVDWMLVSDADTGIINADHCLEEYIHPKADIILYERFFSSEIASGNYFAKNTRNAVKFIEQWANIELEEPPMPYYFSADNGAIHLQVLRTIYPGQEAMHSNCVDRVRLSEWPNWEPGYGAFVRCVKAHMLRYNVQRDGATWAKLLLFPRAQAWVRDARETWYNYYTGDFMAHGIKETAPYDQKMLDRLTMLWQGKIPDECHNTEWQPKLAEGQLVSETVLRQDLRTSDQHFKNTPLHPLYGNNDFITCWPQCPPDFKTYL